MKSGLRHIGQAISARKLLWAATVFGFVGIYYAGLLAAAIARFRELPNYATLLDWPGNVLRIFEGTPSLVDVWSIVGDEWILDIGRMNYDYGTGVAEWAMTIITGKLSLILLVAILVATALVLLLQLRAAADGPSRLGNSGTAIAAGAALVGVGNATLHWAVACATPSWVASLAMLGMSPGLALWLEPAGGFVSVAGFLIVLSVIVLLARNRSMTGRFSTVYRQSGSAGRGGRYHA